MNLEDAYGVVILHAVGFTYIFHLSLLRISAFLFKVFDNMQYLSTHECWSYGWNQTHLIALVPYLARQQVVTHK